ncbi:MAG: DUF4105 domain-containing protein [Cyclobacteriaceae bacterium]
MREVISRRTSRVLFLLFFLLGSATTAQTRLSDEAEIAMITIGPYQGEVWSAFGHSGIRVYDPQNNIDWFYNYGLYDFDQENFFLNFAKGLLKYRVGVGRYENVVKFYSGQNRSIREQYLNLNRVEKQQFFNFLQNNIRPENAEYIYNYVYDNCATKLRDITEELYPGRVSFDMSYVEEGKTVRDLMDDYLDYQPWGEFGINLGLGTQIDVEAPGYDYMFLPDYIFKAFAGAKLKNDSSEVLLVSRTEIIYTPTEELHSKSLLTPQAFFVLLFFIIGFITNRNFKTGKRTRWIDTFLFSLAGFVGMWVAFLWLGTEHLSKWNLNILWAIPFHLPIAFMISRERFRKFMRNYFKIVAIWYCVLLVIWVLLPQPLGMPLVPLVLAMVLRGFYISYDLRGTKGKMQAG